MIIGRCTHRNVHMYIFTEKTYNYITYGELHACIHTHIHTHKHTFVNARIKFTCELDVRIFILNYIPVCIYKSTSDVLAAPEQKGI